MAENRSLTGDENLVLRARGVTCSYGRYRVLHGLDFRILAGEKVALVGPNGAGKSTLMRLIAGLHEIDSGHLSLWKRRPTSLQVRRRVAYLPEQNPLPDTFRVEEYLEDRRRLYGTTKSLVDEAITRLDLEGWCRRPIRELSHGTRRRVGLAAAWVTGADLFVLDEPTSGLDPRQIRELRALLKSLDKTLLVSTHIIPDAEAICDRYLLVASGELVSSGPVEQLDAAFREMIG